MKMLFSLMALLLSATMFDAHAQQKPVKVYILVGQSNMEGHAMTRTFDYIGDDPATAPLLKKMRGTDGKPTVCKDVYISNLTEFFDQSGVKSGRLTAGYGARRNPNELGDKIGPEFTFGLTMQEAYDGPILIIKPAWGGKSLHTDFRPPSAGPYELNDWQKERYPKQEGHGIPQNLEQWKADKIEATGRYYRLMIDHIQAVLGDIKTIYPDYDAEQGYELAGLVWFQGWNDMVDSHTYPNYHDPQKYALYTELFGHFIRDVRNDLDAPKLPFVIGVMGVGGPIDHAYNEGSLKKSLTFFRAAMEAPAAQAEFKGSVVAVETWPYWDTDLATIEKKRDKVRQMAHLLRTENKNHANQDGTMSAQDQKAYLAKMEAELITDADKALWERGASNAGYHYLGSAKTMAQIGQAFATALLDMN